jgi:tetratricopeptide (TPR) repeat protein
MAQSNLGLALATEGRSDEALEHFRAAKALHKYPAAQLLTLAMYELRTGHPQEAIAECDGVLKSSSDAKLGATAWGERGEAALQLGHYDEAAGNFQNALRLNRDEGAALTGLGMLALREGKTGAAVEMLTQAARVAPSDVGAYLLSQALRRAGRQAEADAVAGEVARVSPDVHKVEGAAGRVLSLVGLKPL